MMTQLFLERIFDAPLSVADVQAYAREGGWCFEMHEVKWCASLLAAGGRMMVCWFASPDAESVRLALRQVGADMRRLWIGTVHEAREPTAPNVLVERSFHEAVTLEEIQAIEDAGTWCLQAHGVKFSRTFFSLDRKRMLCLYEAPDAESVRLAQREAGMPFDSVWSFERIGPDTLHSAPIG